MENISQEKDRHQKALALIICLFIGFMYVETIFKPYFYGTPIATPTTATPAQTPAAPSPQTQFIEPSSTAQSSATQYSATQPGSTTANAVQSTFPSDSQIRDAGVLTIETDTSVYEVSLLGGRLIKALLSGYALDHQHLQQSYNLVKHIEFAPFPLGVYSGGVNDAWVQYSVTAGSGLSDNRLVLKGTAEPRVIHLVGTLSDGRQVTKELTFRPDGYRISLRAELSQAASDGARAEIEWNKFADDKEASFLDPSDIAEFVWYDGQKAGRQTFPDTEEAKKELGDVQWTSVSDKYFFAAVLRPEAMGPATVFRTGNLFRFRLSGESQSVGVDVVLGPKRYEYLEQVGHELTRVVNFGRLGFISAPLLSLLHFFFRIFSNYGLAIVVLTILVKIALYPLNSASFKQMKAMQDLKPEVDRIREQVSDKQQQQLELMALYKKKGVNPLGGCLPILIQMPIFIGLYYALMGAVELRGAHYAMWIHDLSAPEKLMIAGFGIPVMVILFVLSMIVQQATTPSTMDPTQKKVMMVMPVVMGFMFANFPAGLTLYWLTNNLISIGQQKALTYYDTKRTSAFMLTLGVSFAVFALAFVVTLF